MNVRFTSAGFGRNAAIDAQQPPFKSSVLGNIKNCECFTRYLPVLERVNCNDVLKSLSDVIAN
jgi:hypothetical protein